MRYCIIFLIFLCSHMTSIGQKPFYPEMEYKNGQIRYMEDAFSWNKAGKFFIDSPFEKDYAKYKKAKRTGRILGYFTLAEMGISIALISSDNSAYDGISPSQVFGILVLIVVVPITGTIGIISALTGLNRRLKLIDVFNEQIPNTSLHQLERNNWELSLSFSEVGVGLRLSF